MVTGGDTAVYLAPALALGLAPTCSLSSTRLQSTDYRAPAPALAPVLAPTHSLSDPIPTVKADA